MSLISDFRTTTNCFPLAIFWLFKVFCCLLWKLISYSTSFYIVSKRYYTLNCSSQIKVIKHRAKFIFYTFFLHLSKTLLHFKKVGHFCQSLSNNTTGSPSQKSVYGKDVKVSANTLLKHLVYIFFILLIWFSGSLY